MTGGQPWDPPSGAPAGGWGGASGGPGSAPGPSGAPGSLGWGPAGSAPGGSGPAGSGSFGGGGSSAAGGPGAGGFDGPGPVVLPRPVRPPVPWLVASLLASVVGGSLAGALGADPWWAFAGWGLGGFVAIGLLAVFARGDALRRAAPVWVDLPWVRGLYVVAAAAALTAVVIGALRLALWAGRL